MSRFLYSYVKPKLLIIALQRTVHPKLSATELFQCCYRCFVIGRELIIITDKPT